MTPEDRIRSMLLAGDNRLKQGHDARTLAKARASFDEALEVAEQHGLAERIRPLVEARLAALDELGAPE